MAIKVFAPETQFTKMNLRKDPTSLNTNEGEFALLVNGRIRNGGIETIKLPQEITSLPLGGNIQGIYGFDRYLLVFVNGLAYVRDYTQNNQIFRQIEGFLMSQTAPIIYACAVPASTVNFKRVPTVDSGEVVVSSPVSLVGATNGSPACVVCQDGVTQPFVIFPDGTARATSNYNGWADETNREYVPVGRQMVYLNGILYIVIQDVNGLFTMLAHSVTGRPLDFMVNIDTDGNKLDTEADGGALTVAYNVDYGEVTCVSLVGSTGGAFFVSTVKSAYLVTPDTNNTVFNEPTFTNQILFATGANNNFSTVDLLGDAALIDLEGIKSFNAVLQLKFAGKNAPFSADLAPAFGNITQTITAAENYDNYAHFAVTTSYGPAVMVYDTMLNGFASIDIYPGIAAIKQFAVIRLPSLKQFFFITVDNKLYQAFGSDTTATAEFYPREWCPDISAYKAGSYSEDQTSPGNELKPMLLGVTFVDINESGRVDATVFLDSQEITTLGETITQDNTVSLTPKQRPFGDRAKDKVRPVAINLESVPNGYKCGFYIKWNFNARLQAITFVADILATANNYKQQSREYKKFNELLKMTKP